MFVTDQNSVKNNLKVARRALLTTSTVSLLACLAFSSPVALAQSTIEPFEVPDVTADNADVVITNDSEPQIDSEENDQTFFVGSDVDLTFVSTSGNADGSLFRIDGNGDDITFVNNGILTSDNGDDEEVVVFVDNAENNAIIANNGTLSGNDGVVFFEGDAATLINNGTIVGTDVATEGVVYFDRDADSETNVVLNSGVISSVGGGAIVVDTLLGSVGGSDPEEAMADNAPVTFSGVATLDLTNTGTITNTGTEGDTEAIRFDGAPGNTSEGSLEIDRAEELAQFDFPAGTTGFAAIIDSDSDASPRRCIENVAGTSGPAINCQVNVTIENSGVISSTAGDAIANTNDAVLNGTINNAEGGTISGATAGVQVTGAHSEHDLAINNSGTISASAGDGVVVSGDGVALTNLAGATISGTDAGLVVEASAFTIESVGRNALNNQNILVDDGSGAAIPEVTTVDITNTNLNNTFTNSGTISGGTASVDLTDAGSAITFSQIGGALTGNFLGTTEFEDVLNISGENFSLTNDVLQSVNVNVASGTTVTFVGDRTIDGNLVSDGNLGLDVANTQIVNGDVTLNADSTVTVLDAGLISAIDTNFTLIDVGGTLTNNSTLVNGVEDTSFLLDFETVEDASGDLVVRAVAAAGDMPMDDMPMDDMPMDDMPMDDMPVGDMPMDDMPVGDVPPPPPPPPPPSVELNDTELNLFGASVISAFVSGGLNNTTSFSALAGLETGEDVANEVANLAPDLSNSVPQEAFRAIVDTTGIISQRLSNLKRSASANGPALYASNSLTGLSKERYSTAQSGAWIQGGYRYAKQENVTSQSQSLLTNGYDANSVTIALGYDYALDDNTILGLSGSYTDLNLDSRSTIESERDVSVFQVGAYAARQYGSLQISGQASYAFGDVDAEREAFEQITGEFDIDGFNFQGLASYDYEFGNGYYVEPHVSLQYSNVSTDAFTEVGGLGLTIDDTSNDYFEGRAGATLGFRSNLDETAYTDFYATVGVITDFSGDPDELNLNFANQNVSVLGLDSEDTRLETILGVNIFSSGSWSVGGTLNGEWASDYTAVGGNLRLKYNF